MTPLRFRLPNPPPVFVGRVSERRRLDEQLAQTPLSLVVGAGGIGKSAFVRTVSWAWRERTGLPVIQVHLRPGDPFVAMLAGIGEGLQLPDRMAWFRGGLEAVMAGVLAAAERQKALVVIEDIHHVEPERLDSWFMMLQSHGRQSRWLMTSRPLPTETYGSADPLNLGPLKQAEGLALVQACAPDANNQACTQILSQAAGSPLELRRLAAASRVPADVLARPVSTSGKSGQSLLAGTPLDARPMLEALAQTTLALRLPDIQAAVKVPADETLQGLVSAGVLVQESGDRWRLHDSVREQLVVQMGPNRSGKVGRKVAERLARRDDPDAVMEALRSGQGLSTAFSLKLLDDRWEILGERSETGRLWRFLRTSGPQLRLHALRAALEAETPEALRWAAIHTPPLEADLDTRFALLVARQRVAIGVETLADDFGALANRSAAAGNETVAFSATVMAADVAFGAGRITEAEQWANSAVHPLPNLAAHSTADGNTQVVRATQVRRQALLARISELNGEYDLARKWANSARENASELPADVRLSALRRAHFVALPELDPVDQKVSISRGFWPGFLAGVQAGLALDGKRLDAVDEALKALDLTSTEVVMRHLLTVFRGLVGGHSREVYNGSVVALAKALETEDWIGLQWALISHHAAAWATIRSSDPPAWPTSLPAPGGTHGAFIDIMADLASLDSDGAPTEPLRFDLSKREHKDVGDPALNALTALARSLSSLLARRFDESLVMLSQAIPLAASPNLRMVSLIAQCQQVFALAGLGREAELQQVLETFSELVRQSSSPFAAQCFTFLDAVFGAEPRAWDLEVVATEWETNAVTAHWARSLLGGDLPQPCSHRLAVQLASARWGGGTLERCRSGEVWTQGWGLDVARRTVWTLDGRIVPMNRAKTLRRLLLLIARAPEGATKTALVEGIWKREYHPLEDDTRLQVAIGRLRKLLGDSVETPRHILTTEDGYALSPAPFTIVHAAR